MITRENQKLSHGIYHHGASGQAYIANNCKLELYRVELYNYTNNKPKHVTTGCLLRWQLNYKY